MLISTVRFNNATRYDLPTINEIAAIFPRDGHLKSRIIITHEQEDGFE